MLHTIAKHRVEKWDEEETAHVDWIVAHSNNLLITNIFGSNCLRTCKRCNSKNLDVFESMLVTKLNGKMAKITLVMMKRLKEKTKLHRFVVREIYKYIDG